LYFLYSVVTGVLFLLALPYFFWKGRATGKYLRTFGERMGRLPVYLNVDGERSIWIHAVSVGEVLAARTLVEPMRRRAAGRRLFLSTTTMTGKAVAEKHAVGLDGLFYAPFDWPHPVRASLETLNPDLLVLVETELWPNLIHEARRRGARVALVNGRISPRSFERYQLVKPLLSRVLGEVDLFLMQADAHAERILALGAPPERVRVSGNLKFDALDAPRTPDRLRSIMAPSGSGAGVNPAPPRGLRRDGSFAPAPPGGQDHRPLIVAGSTMAGEEELVLQAYHAVREAVPEARLVIAPRHPERFDQVPALIEAAGFRCARRSRTDPGGWRPGEVMLLDTLGELAQVYPLASAVFVGGSLVPTGGHNVLEAAVAGRAIVVGPSMTNFQEIAELFLAEKAMVQVASPAELGRELQALLRDEPRRRALGERARGLIDRNRGALDTTVEALAALLGPARA
jgi:3-deoxy-D-manno-octulosonic-acid transferase